MEAPEDIQVLFLAFPQSRAADFGQAFAYFGTYLQAGVWEWAVGDPEVEGDPETCAEEAPANANPYEADPVGADAST